MTDNLQETHAPVCVAQSGPETLVICDDGSVYRFHVATGQLWSWRWVEMTPIPGTLAAQKAERKHKGKP